MTVLLCKACDRYTEHSQAGRRLVCRRCGGTSYEVSAPKPEAKRKPSENSVK